MVEGKRKKISCESDKKDGGLGEMYQSSFPQGTDWKSAFHQQQELFKQARTSPNTHLSGIKDDIPKHQPDKRNRQGAATSIKL